MGRAADAAEHTLPGGSRGRSPLSIARCYLLIPNYDTCTKSRKVRAFKIDPVDF
jgi:hypothetical protein